MKIAVLAPPEIPIPIGDGYGGIELIAQDFADAVSKAGHDVDLYCASEEKWTSSGENLVRLVPYPNDLGPIGGDYDYTFDFTHNKPLSKNYGPTEYAATTFLTDRVSMVNDVFPTRAVKAGFPYVPGPVIYPGIRDVYEYRKEKGGYLLFLGRVAQYKRPDVALQVARLSSTPIIVAGHVGQFSEWPTPGYGDMIKGACRKQEGAHFVPNPTLAEKRELLAGAVALLVPSDWSVIGSQESFGIVAVEALMSGTPVITSGDGGLKEIVADKSHGAVCRSLTEYLAAVEDAKSGKFLPESCKAMGNYFRSERMAAEYLAFAKGVEA